MKTTLPLSDIVHLLPLAGGGVVFASAAPAFGVLEATGQRRFFHSPALADLEGGQAHFRVNHDGTLVQFGSARFALGDRTLTLQPAEDSALTPPVTNAPELHIANWELTPTPTLNGTELELAPTETSLSLAIAPDRLRFLVGATLFLHLFDSHGREQWKTLVPAIVRYVNIAGNGQVAVAALGDGTIRWYRLRDGKELLAFYSHPDRKRWVLWTPSGYYDTSVGGEEFLGWHVNRGREAAADFFPIDQFREKYYRPDVVAKAIKPQEERAAEQASADPPRPERPLLQQLPPVVEVVAPSEGAVVSQSEVRVRFRLRSPSAPLSELKVQVEGRPVGTIGDVAQVAGEPELWEARVLIPPPAIQEFDLTLIARNQHGPSAPATVHLRWQGATPTVVAGGRGPKLYVLAVGVGAYRDKGMQLDFTTKDAQATKTNILKGLAWLQRETTSKDVAMLFLSGHGQTDPSNVRIGYFLPVDYAPGELKATGLLMTELNNTIEAIAGKVVVFLDACHAGNVAPEETKSKGEWLLDITKVVNELSSAERGAVVFASSTGLELSYGGKKWGNSVFTKAVVEGLQGEADARRTGRVTVTMLDAYIADRVKELTNGMQHPTTAKPKTTQDFPIAALRR